MVAVEVLGEYSAASDHIMYKTGKKIPCRFLLYS